MSNNEDLTLPPTEDDVLRRHRTHSLARDIVNEVISGASPRGG